MPPLVTQIADGENGGVMMNEFPSKYDEVVRNASWGEVPLMNASEYLEHLFALGIRQADLPVGAAALPQAHLGAHEAGRRAASGWRR